MYKHENHADHFKFVQSYLVRIIHRSKLHEIFMPDQYGGSQCALFKYIFMMKFFPLNVFGHNHGVAYKCLV